MTPEIQKWVKIMVDAYKPEAPVLEVGSYNVNGSVREFFPEPYTGMDMKEGPGVDWVWDAEEPWKGHYKTIVCCETLEHTRKPQLVVDNIARSLLPGGIFICTVPFMLAEHDYPHDYWRMTRAGMFEIMFSAGFRDMRIERSPSGTHTLGVAIKP